MITPDGRATRRIAIAGQDQLEWRELTHKSAEFRDTQHGELFVEYQLAAQQMRPDGIVCMAAYGDYGTGYIGTEIAYSQGGYETQPSSSNTAPQVERVLMDGCEPYWSKPR